MRSCLAPLNLRARVFWGGRGGLVVAPSQEESGLMKIPRGQRRSGHRAAVFVVDLQRAAKVRFRPKADVRRPEHRILLRTTTGATITDFGISLEPRSRTAARLLDTN